MRRYLGSDRLTIAALLAVVATLSTAAVRRVPSVAPEGGMPYAEAGLNEREAAAHLLDRFTFGATSGQLDAVVELGIERWFTRQLEANEPSDDLDGKLAQLRTLDLSNEEIIQSYPRPGQVRRQAMEEGRLDPSLDPQAARRALRAYYEEHGYKPQRQLVGELMAQKVFRVTLATNQVEEVMVDFWFNHFYVSATDNQCRRFIGTYERDAIRPFVFASFGAMLESTAKHPAMLLYLDNAQSSALDGAMTTASARRDVLRQRPGREGKRYQRAFEKAEQQKQKRAQQMTDGGNVPRRGINENYARELLELHTLGVDGGYEQRDVEEVARALTGWTVLPGPQAARVKERLREHKQMAADLGFVMDGDFFFNAERHDAGAKTILGRHFGRDGGLQEGEDVLRLLVEHPSTARHIALKLAVRFVSDDPPAAFVDGLAQVFTSARGDMKTMMGYIVRSPYFWSARRAKIKSPLELVASSVRAVGAQVNNPRALVEWMDKMGQPLYRYQVPTGFPDRADAWINAGALLHRMNYGMSLAIGNIRGVRTELKPLLDGREPESAEAALHAWARVLLPERDMTATVEVLLTMLNERDIAAQIDERSQSVAPPAIDPDTRMDDDLVLEPFGAEDLQAPQTRSNKPEAHAGARGEAHTIERVVGLLIGSPEFQRR